MATRRKVQLSEEFMIIAELLFPPDHTDPDGAPPWSVFEETPLRLAKEALGRDFEYYEVQKGIASFLTSEAIFIRKPILFWARLVPETNVVEMVDVEIDDTFDADSLDDLND